jgi:hypothetical protein
MLIYINFKFDFLGLDNVDFQIRIRALSYLKHWLSCLN